MKLIKDNFANISILPAKNRVVSLTSLVLFTAKEFLLAELSQSKSMITVVLGFLNGQLIFAQNLEVFFFLFVLEFID